mmetsp:Transcript_25061/g.49024  ORF Transcript_25061/g.49024 Transcript_25061/m.49024 type:complete len:496 (+) Transcript_25061:1-1488(+)
MAAVTVHMGGMERMDTSGMGGGIQFKVNDKISLHSISKLILAAAELSSQPPHPFTDEDDDNLPLQVEEMKKEPCDTDKKAAEKSRETTAISQVFDFLLAHAGCRLHCAVAKFNAKVAVPPGKRAGSAVHLYRLCRDLLSLLRSVHRGFEVTSCGVREEEEKEEGGKKVLRTERDTASVPWDQARFLVRGVLTVLESFVLPVLPDASGVVASHSKSSADKEGKKISNESLWFVVALIFQELGRLSTGLFVATPRSSPPLYSFGGGVESRDEQRAKERGQVRLHHKTAWGERIAVLLAENISRCPPEPLRILSQVPAKSFLRSKDENASTPFLKSFMDLGERFPDTHADTTSMLSEPTFTPRFVGGVPFGLADELRILEERSRRRKKRERSAAVDMETAAQQEGLERKGPVSLDSRSRSLRQGSVNGFPNNRGIHRDRGLNGLADMGIDGPWKGRVKGNDLEPDDRPAPGFRGVGKGNKGLGAIKSVLKSREGLPGD